MCLQPVYAWRLPSAPKIISPQPNEICLGFERVGPCHPPLLFGTCGCWGVSQLGHNECPRQGWCWGAKTLGRLRDHHWRRWVLLRTLRNPQAPASPRTNLSVFSIPVVFLSSESWQSAYASLCSSPDWCLAETLGDPPSPAASGCAFALPLKYEGISNKCDSDHC